VTWCLASPSKQTKINQIPNTKMNNTQMRFAMIKRVIADPSKLRGCPLSEFIATLVRMAYSDVATARALGERQTADELLVSAGELKALQEEAQRNEAMEVAS
jgi:hypothetical protein